MNSGLRLRVRDWNLLPSRHFRKILSRVRAEYPAEVEENRSCVEVQPVWNKRSLADEKKAQVALGHVGSTKEMRYANRRRAKKPTPTSPVPSNPKLPGSGTVLTSVVVAKHVAAGAQNDPATWMFPSVIPLEVSALLRTRNRDVAVPDPVVSKQIVSFEIPPHAPEENVKTPLTSVRVDIVPLTFPENPITGPPSRTEPEVIWISTQTDELEMLMLPHIPPCVRVAVPISIPPKDMLSVMVTESANVAGTAASAAATMTAKVESLTLLRTDVLL